MRIQQGQLLQVQDSPFSWVFGVVIEIFDEQFYVEKQFCGDCMLKLEDEGISYHVLRKEGKPVMSKKNIFGKYTFKSKE